MHENIEQFMMGEGKVRKAINYLSWVFAVITTISLVITVLTLYGFMYNHYFNNYHIFQWCMFFTMLLWGIVSLDIKSTKNNFLHGIIYMLFALSTLFFIMVNVY